MTRVNRVWTGGLLALTVLLNASVVDARSPWKVTLKGTATCHERVALAPDAVFDASLEDVSRGDGHGVVIAHVRMERPGQIPIAFSLSYDSRRVPHEGRYLVRALVSERGAFRLAGTAPYSVHAHGYYGHIVVLMRQAPETGGLPSR